MCSGDDLLFNVDGDVECLASPGDEFANLGVGISLERYYVNPVDEVACEGNETLSSLVDPDDYDFCVGCFLVSQSFI